MSKHKAKITPVNMHSYEYEFTQAFKEQCEKEQLMKAWRPMGMTETEIEAMECSNRIWLIWMIINIVGMSGILLYASYSVK